MVDRYRFPWSARFRPDQVSLPVVLRVRVGGGCPFYGRSSTVHNAPYMLIVVSTSLSASCRFSKLPAGQLIGSPVCIDTLTVPPVADSKVGVSIRSPSSAVVGCARPKLSLIRDAAINFDSQRHRHSLSTSPQLYVAGALSHSRQAAVPCASTDRTIRSRSSFGQLAVWSACRTISSSCSAISACTASSCLHHDGHHSQAGTAAGPDDHCPCPQGSQSRGLVVVVVMATFELG